MCLSADAQVGGLQGVLDLADELMVGDRTPAICGAWCFDVADFIKFHVLCSAVKDEVGCSAGDDDGLRIEVCNHGGVFLFWL